MNNKKFKVGDRVKIINCAHIESYELNKIGIVVKVRNRDFGTYVVDMGRPRREEEPEETCWYLRESAIELANQLNEQLLFNFMYEE